MSQFDQQLKAAKQRQRRLYLGVVASVVAVVLLLLSILLATRGTRIDIMPEEVTQQARLDVSGGLAFITGKTLYAISSNASVTVEAEGFYTRQQQLTDADFGKVMTITLKPLPAKLHLRSPMADNKTKWLIDNQLYIVADEMVRELEPGDYQVSVMHPYFQIKDLNLSLGRGETLEQSVDLEPVAGEFIVNSSPANARVSIGGTEQGSTPHAISLQGGEYQVQVLRDSFEPVTETIAITREAPLVERHYQLEPEKGEVHVVLKPADGKLLVNKLQVKPQASFRLEVNKTHTMSYSKPGFFSQSKSFRVHAETPTHLEFKLEKESGQVELTSTPEAKVAVNGEIVGTTPLTLTLDALPQEITFSKAGYRAVVKQVTPTSSAVKRLNAILVPERIATLQEAPSTYRHKAGGTMKLYKPNDTFSMGAERSEPGQRANEFVKTVKLTRPFYAGVNEVTHAVYSRYDASKSGQANNPVTGISWLDAVKFCNWLSELEGLQTVYRLQGNNLAGIDNNADGYRLLTEAEWEWLARKANRRQQSRFVWGDDTVIPKNTVNIADESAKGTVRNVVPKYNDGYAGIAPSGSFTQELSGQFDQGGNVSEWVHDSYSLSPPKSGQVLIDPFDTSRGDSRVIKGANWRSGTLTELRASYREGLSAARDDVGFRIGRYVTGGVGI